MAYMRGDYYIYRASSDTHDDIIVMHTPEGDFEMDIAHFDALVVMRYAQLEKEKNIKEFEREVADNFQGNIGNDALCEKVGIKTARQQIEEAVKNSEK